MAREEQGRDLYRGREERHQIFRRFKDVQHSHHRLRKGFSALKVGFAVADARVAQLGDRSPQDCSAPHWTRHMR